MMFCSYKAYPWVNSCQYMKRLLDKEFVVDTNLITNVMQTQQTQNVQLDFYQTTLALTSWPNQYKLYLVLNLDDK